MAYPKRSLLHADVNKKIGYVPGISVSSSRRIFTDNNLQQGSSQISFPYVGSFRANLPRDIPPDQRRHVAENIGKTRSCFVCARQKIRTQGGVHVYSRYKCQLCDVVLCKGIRNCFRQYHEELGVPLD